MLTKDLINQIIDLKQSQIVNINGAHWFQTNGSISLLKHPVSENTKCFSISELVNAVKRNGIGVVNIKDHENVEAFDPVQGPNKERQYIATTSCDEMYERFESGREMSQEQMIVALQTQFADSADRKDLLKLISSLKNESVTISSDDGVSQVVSAKAGVALATEVQIRNPWILKPFKSFPEITPVDVPHILRVKRGSSMPLLSLTEADGGRWKVVTVQVVKAWISTTLGDVKGIEVL